MGNNRYELLFMDDDIGGGDPLDNVVAKSKKQVKTTSSVPNQSTNLNTGTSSATKSTSKSNTESAKTSGQNKKSAEKDKSSTIKNEASNKGKPSGGDKTASKQGGSTATNTTGPNNNNNNNNNNRNNKRNVAAGGETGQQSQQQPQQQQRNNNANLKPQNGNETREQRNNRRNVRENGFSTPGNESTTNQQQQPRQFRDRDQRGPPRNRNFEGGNRKREFDRQSGSDKTGVKAVDKRDGTGPHNWGSVKEAIDEVNKNDLDSSAAVGEKSEDSGNEQPNEPTPTAEEEAKELTLDEYKAQMLQRAKPTFNLRKAGEGEDTTQWKKMHVLHSNKKKETESEEELEFDPAMYPQRVGRQQRVLDIQFNFNDGRRGGGWGGRGGRGGGGAGGPRGPRPGNNAAAASAANTASTAANEGGNPDRPPRNVRVNNNAGGGGSGGVGGGSGAGAGGKRHFGDRQPFSAAPKVNDERQFPTLA